MLDTYQEIRNVKVNRHGNRLVLCHATWRFALYNPAPLYSVVYQSLEQNGRVKTFVHINEEYYDNARDAGAAFNMRLNSEDPAAATNWLWQMVWAEKLLTRTALLDRM